jgi:hypothetical protein
VSEHALCKTPGERQNVVVHVSIEECSVHDIDHSQLVAVKPIRFLVVFAFAVVFFVAVWLWHQLIAARHSALTTDTPTPCRPPDTL